MSSQQTPLVTPPKPITALKARQMDFDVRVKLSDETKQRYEDARAQNAKNYDNGVFFDGSKRDTGNRLAELNDLIKTVRENVQNNGSRDWSFGFYGGHADPTALNTFANVDVVFRLRDIFRAMYRDIELPFQLSQNAGYGASQLSGRLKAHQDQLAEKVEALDKPIADTLQPGGELLPRFTMRPRAPITLPKGCTVCVETPFGVSVMLFIPVELLTLDFKFNKAILFDERVNWIGARFTVASLNMTVSETLAIIRALILGNDEGPITENAFISPLVKTKSEGHVFNDSIYASHPLLILHHTSFAHTCYGYAVFLLRTLSYVIREEIGKSDALKQYADKTPGQRVFSTNDIFKVPTLPNMSFTYNEYTKTLRVRLDGIAQSFDLNPEALSAYTLGKESYPVLSEIVDRFDPFDPVIEILEQALGGVMNDGKTAPFVVYEMRQVEHHNSYHNTPTNLFENNFGFVDTNLTLAEMGKTNENDNHDFTGL